ncbi:hypothetical protein SAMN05192549_112163 [Duganella sacchari]|uniref:Uncharacterized protein n=1 Tax=Duganella sacchari TaxID=551987 RepID=A0A1M7TCD0_9BURK|nr:hypothetical protein [Duganella sacchari]SHN68353.1 hypothetical protein SAMN05192549_112163 [Duganella sacchari]
MKIDTNALSSALAASSSQVKKSDGNTGFGAILKQAETKQSAAAAELEKYVKMTPAERMTQAMMKKLGISQDKFDAMSPDQQAAVMRKVRDMLKQEMEEAAQKQGAAASGAV